MAALVTIAIPIYKRLEYLPGLLEAVALQDYPNLELIVSDNGQNGSAVVDAVRGHYSRPYRVRQNSTTVSIPAHYSQVLSEAKGKYFVWLADDDSIGSTFVSELVAILEQHPEVSVAIAQQEVIDASGRVLRRSSDRVPDFLSGEEFVRNWTAYGYENYSTVMARTGDVRQCGGYGDFANGTASDDALLIKLCLRGAVALSKRCIFRYRWHQTSYGFSMNPRQLANDLRMFLSFLETDEVILAYAAQRPDAWSRMRANIVQMVWQTYFNRWKTMYRERLSTPAWVMAAFAMPYVHDYYRAVGRELWSSLKSPLAKRARINFLS
jgi:glycosyltransferase involved in cell wall biosynthesis